MVRIRYVLISEGSSDDALQAHLENLCIDQGAAEVTGIAPDFGRLPDRVGHSVEQKVRAAIELESTANLFFIHRDADDRRPEHRISEITAAVAGARLAQAHVPIVPVQATEAWLLLDESAIRRAAYRPDGTRPLGLPRPREVEKRADPKELLRMALATASELTGRRLERFRREFARQRRLLLLQLPIGGALESVPSWCRLRDDLASAIALLRDR